jgi:thiosulfate dehydrogenase
MIRKLTLSALLMAMALAIPLSAMAKEETVDRNCASMSDWYECRDIKTAPPLAQEGYELIHNTPITLGPSGYIKGADGKPIINGTYSCDSCHFGGGEIPGGIPFFQVRDKYAGEGYWWPAGNKLRKIRERINWCLVSCANGQFLPEDHPAMDAMVAYMEWLADGIQDPSMLGKEGWKNIPGHDMPLVSPGALKLSANAARGEQIYWESCDECHGDRGPGRGRYDEGEPRARVPALWGAGAFTKGAQGMHTVPQLAFLIKGFMPLGETGLSVQEALDVSGFINTMPRDMGYFTIDYFREGTDPKTGVPNYLLKPSFFAVGAEIPNDPFSYEQRLLGPWQPIEDWQAAERAKWLAENPAPANN